MPNMQNTFWKTYMVSLLIDERSQKNSLMTSQQNINGIINNIKVSEDINRTVQIKNRILNIEVKEGNHKKNH